MCSWYWRLNWETWKGPLMMNVKWVKRRNKHPKLNDIDLHPHWIPVQHQVRSKAVARLQAPTGSLRNCKHQTSRLLAPHEGTLEPSTQAENKSKSVTFWLMHCKKLQPAKFLIGLIYLSIKEENIHYDHNKWLNLVRNKEYIPIYLPILRRKIKPIFFKKNLCWGDEWFMEFPQNLLFL